MGTGNEKTYTTTAFRTHVLRRYWYTRFLIPQTPVHNQNVNKTTIETLIRRLYTLIFPIYVVTFL